MTSINKVIFFIMLSVVFCIFFLSTRHFYSNIKDNASLKRSVIVIISSIIFSLFFVGYTQVTGLIEIEGFKFYHERENLQENKDK
jgi:hypothetical protein